MRFSPSVLGWFPEHIDYPALPADVVIVSDELYAALVGKQIEAGPDGQPREAMPPAPSVEDLKRQLLQAVDGRLNAAANAKGYDSIVTAALRAGYPGPFHEEGVRFATWMDATYAHCYAVLAQVEAGARPIPTEAELMAELPSFPGA